MSHSFFGDEDAVCDEFDRVRQFQAAELDTSEPCRLTNDPAPYPSDETEGASFPSLFLPVFVGSKRTFSDMELEHTWEELEKFVKKCLASNTLPGDIVDSVLKYYDDKVKAIFPAAPDWSKKSIYRYIYKDHERQANEAIHGVNNAMEFLRSQLGTRRQDGTVHVNSENVKLFLAASKVHATLVDAKKKRDSK